MHETPSTYKCIQGTSRWHRGLASKTIQGTALPLQGIHNIHGGDSLPLGMLSVGDGVTNGILQENLQDTSSLLVDKARDPLHSTPPSQSPNGRLGDPLDVVSENFSVPLGSSLAQTLASLSTPSHNETGECC